MRLSIAPLRPYLSYKADGDSRHLLCQCTMNWFLQSQVKSTRSRSLFVYLLILFRLHITFIDKEGGEHTFDVAKGDNLLDIAQENDIEMEGKKM